MLHCINLSLYETSNSDEAYELVIGIGQDVLFLFLHIMNSKTTVMLYNLHWHLYTGDGEEAGSFGGKAEEV